MHGRTGRRARWPPTNLTVHQLGQAPTQLQLGLQAAYPVMYFVDMEFDGGPSTCSGDAVAVPTGGKSRWMRHSMRCTPRRISTSIRVCSHDGYAMSALQYQAVYNALSFSLASVTATTVRLGSVHLQSKTNTRTPSTVPDRIQRALMFFLQA